MFPRSLVSKNLQNEPETSNITKAHGQPLIITSQTKEHPSSHAKTKTYGSSVIIGLSNKLIDVMLKSWKPNTSK